MPATFEQLQRKQRIAKELVRIETERPGSIRMKPNPWCCSFALDHLAEIGYKKPFLASRQQFAIDCFLTYPDACDRLLTYCFLVGERNSQGLLPLWNGFGDYKASWSTLPQFQGNESIIYVLGVAPVLFFPVDGGILFYQLLEPASE